MRLGGVAVLALALIVAACGDDDDGATNASTSTPAQTEAPSSTGTQPAETDVATTAGGSSDSVAATDTDQAPTSDVDLDSIDNDAKFVYAETAPIPGLDPIKSNSSAQWPLLIPMFDTLVYGNPDGTFGPGIASDWELSPDGTTFTMTIAEGRTFQDGTPIDAAAVKANLDRALNDPASLVTGMDNVTAVAAEGDTVTLTLNDKAGGRLPSQLATTAGMMVSPASFGTPQIDTAPIGSGPFKIVSFAPDAIAYERWDGYYDAPNVHIADLEIRILPDDNTRLAALKSGQIDATFLRPQQKADAEAAGNLKVDTWYSAQLYGLLLNTTTPALANADVRKAIMQAIDRDAIAASLYSGGCFSTVQPHVPDTGGYNPDVTVDEYGKYDPDAVRKQLADAGFPNFELRTAVPNLPQYTTLFEVLQAQLGEVGISLVANIQEPTQFVESLRNGTDEAYVSVLGTGQPDPLTFWKTYYVSGGQYNPENFSSPAITAAYDEAAATIDANTQYSSILEMVQSTVDEGPRVIPVCVPQLVMATSERVNGVPLPVNFDFHFNDVTVSKN